MTPKTLRVRVADRSPAAPPLVQNHEKLERGTNSFIGVRYQETSPGVWAFVPTGQPEEVPYRAEYIHALVAGDLIPDDAESAIAARLDWKEPAKGDKPIDIASAFATGTTGTLVHPELKEAPAAPGEPRELVFAGRAVSGGPPVVAEVTGDGTGEALPPIDKSNHDGGH